MNTLPQAQRGMVLASVLLFLMILALLAISSLDTAWLELQMSRNLRDQIQALAWAETALREGEIAVMSGAPIACYTRKEDTRLREPSTVDEHPPAACQAAQGHAGYRVEFLAHEPCVQIIGAEHDGADFYQVTAELIDSAAGSGVVLQSFIAKPAADAVECTAKTKHVISNGRQAWREFV